MGRVRQARPCVEFAWGVQDPNCWMVATGTYEPDRCRVASVHMVILPSLQPAVNLAATVPEAERAPWEGAWQDSEYVSWARQMVG
jgi:hypothetical protein